jgi:hypothetical protein
MGSHFPTGRKAGIAGFRFSIRRSRSWRTERSFGVRAACCRFCLRQLAGAIACVSAVALLPPSARWHSCLMRKDAGGGFFHGRPALDGSLAGNELPPEKATASCAHSKASRRARSFLPSRLGRSRALRLVCKDGFEILSKTTIPTSLSRTEPPPPPAHR